MGNSPHHPKAFNSCLDRPGLCPLTQPPFHPASAAECQHGRHSRPHSVPRRGVIRTALQSAASLLYAFLTVADDAVRNLQ